MLTRRITPAFALGTPALAFFQPCSRWCKNGDALRGSVDELVEACVELAEVAEHQRLDLPERAAKVSLAAALGVFDLGTVRTVPALRARRRVSRAGDLVHLVQLATVFPVDRARPGLHRVRLLLRHALLHVLNEEVDLLQLEERAGPDHGTMWLTTLSISMSGTTPCLRLCRSPSPFFLQPGTVRRWPEHRSSHWSMY